MWRVPHNGANQTQANSIGQSASEDDREKKRYMEQTFFNTSWFNSRFGPNPDRPTHLGVIAREDLQSHRGDEFSDKVKPLVIKIDLFHMYVIRWDTLVASSDSLVLRMENRRLDIQSLINLQCYRDVIWKSDRNRFLDAFMCHQDTTNSWRNLLIQFTNPTEWFIYESDLFTNQTLTNQFNSSLEKMIT